MRDCFHPINLPSNDLPTVRVCFEQNRFKFALVFPTKPTPLSIPPSKIVLSFDYASAPINLPIGCL